jgi:uncharacterized membrane protein
VKEMETRGDAKDASVNEPSSARLVSVGPDRIKAFSDGVFAIALTLLILQVKVPSPSQITGEADLQSFLLQQWPAYLSYALSVVIIGLYWVAHHGLFHYIRRANRMLLWLNILFLLCVTFIPFPAALMGEFSTYRTSVVIYGASLAAAGLVFDLMRWYATHQHRLVDKDLHPQVIRTARRRNLTGPLIYLLGIIVSFIPFNISGISGIQVCLALYVLVPVIYLLPGRTDSYWAGKLPTEKGLAEFLTKAKFVISYWTGKLPIKKGRDG